ncbi:epoxide hydrolase family protein [Streptomyces shenzhenensis]|uniref:epoxide hydrolase family protein n=1 Tax=Streptomyces shenzhenensis TaxID=943815 RepID=UPI0033DD2FED
MSEDAVVPFRIEIPQTDVDTLRRRLAETRWSPPLAGADDWSRGVPVPYLRELAEYWRNGFDWRVWEARLNRHPQFTTTIDGVRIHFIHARSPRADAIPLLLLHGWPGSVVEFLGIIDELADPADAQAPAFHVVAPSLPGYGFSGIPTEPGWGSERIADALAELMTRIGYDRFGVQGGDLGAIIGPVIGRQHPERTIAIHANAATQGFVVADLNDPGCAALGERDAERARRWAEFSVLGSGYMLEQSTRPQTLAHLLHDSPVGQLAWIVEKFKEWTFPADGAPHEAVDRDQLLANVSVYWFTGTGGSAANLYAEMLGTWFPYPPASPVPTGVAVFAEDFAVRSFAERSHTIVRWTDFDFGGHFAAMEVPEALLADIRRFFADVVAAKPA